MYKYQLTIGLNDKITKKQEITNEAAHLKLDDILLNHFGIYAYTKFNCLGCYKHDNGEIVNEKSIRLEIASDKNMRKDIYTLVRTLKRIFNQESIMVEISESNITF